MLFRPDPRLWVGLLSFLIGAAGQASHGDPRPNVLLVTIDTLRPDALGWIAGSNETPVIDALAAGGFRFPGAVSPAPLTQPAHASVMTALVPRRHGVRDNGIVLNEEYPTLAEELADHGYTTGAFISGFPLSSEMGIGRGFQHYDDDLGSNSGRAVERTASATAEAACAWLTRAEEPWFLWVHYYDPHDPYEPPTSFVQPGSRGSYDGEVAYVDHSIGELRAEIAKTVEGSVLTVLTADHGESLGEHGENTHGFFVYESTVAVPLIIHWPGRVSVGESRQPVRLVDVAPTVLDLIDVPALSGNLDGVSLEPLLEGKELTLPPAYVEAQRPWLSYGWAPLRAVRHGPWKLIAAPRSELYNLDEDPGETTNLVRKARRKASELSKVVLDFESNEASTTGSAPPSRHAKELAALGYVGSSTAAETAPPSGLPDPKDRLDEWRQLSAALELFENRHYDQAIIGFDRVLEKEPDNPFALTRSAAAMNAAGRQASAIERFRRALELRPNDTESRFQLASALNAVGKDDEAAREWRMLTELEGSGAQVWINLATSLGRVGKEVEATRALEEAASRAPHRLDLLIRLAQIELTGGNLASGANWLRQASERSDGGEFGHNSTLGLVLIRLGREREARIWLRKSEPREGDFARGRFELAALEAREGNLEVALLALSESLKADPTLEGLIASRPELHSIWRR